MTQISQTEERYHFCFKLSNNRGSAVNLRVESKPSWNDRYRLSLLFAWHEDAQVVYIELGKKKKKAEDNSETVILCWQLILELVNKTSLAETESQI